MSEYISEISTIIESLAVAGEVLSDDEIVLLTLGGLDQDFESFITTVTTRSDRVTFLDLQDLLINQEIREQQLMVANPFSTNVMSRGGANHDLKNNPCQICSKEEHGAINCHNKYNSRFPPTHNYRLPGMPNGNPSANVACVENTFDSKSVWYPDSRATNHITNDVGNLQRAHVYKEGVGKGPSVKEGSA